MPRAEYLLIETLVVAGRQGFARRQPEGAMPVRLPLLTGQPAITVRGFMRREGIPVRHPGGRTPFLRRWRRRQ